jgi:hypothetical protein
MPAGILAADSRVSQPNSTVAAVCLLLPLWWVPLPGQLPPHIRALSTRLANAVSLLAQRSATFEGLVRKVDASDVIVHLVEQQDPCGFAVKSCTSVTGDRGGHRYVRVAVRTMQPYADLLQQVAHELQHVVEIAGDRAVRDASASLALCDRIGWRAGSRCETPAAQDVSSRVIAELSRQR